MNEIGAAAKHLYDTLTGDADLDALVGDRIYPDVAPEGASYPFVVISHAGGNDRRVPGADARIMTRDRWLITAHVNVNNPALARRISGLIDAALVGSTGTISLNSQTYYVLSVYREQAVERGGNVNGVYYLQSGGYYRTPVSTR